MQERTQDRRGHTCSGDRRGHTCRAAASGRPLTRFAHTDDSPSLTSAESLPVLPQCRVVVSVTHCVDAESLPASPTEFRVVDSVTHCTLPSRCQCYPMPSRCLGHPLCGGEPLTDLCRVVASVTR